MNLKLERYPEGVIGREGEVCSSCLGMGAAGTRATAVRWAYGEPTPPKVIHLCDTCLLAIHARVGDYIRANAVTPRRRGR